MAGSLSPTLDMQGSTELPHAEKSLPFSLRAYFKETVDALSWRLAHAFGLMLLISLTEGFGLLFLVPLLQLTGLELGVGPADQVAKSVAQVFRTAQIPLSLATILCAYVIILSGRALLSRYEGVSSFKLQQTLVAHLREKLYRALTEANWLFFVRSRNSDFMHALTRELEIVGAATFTLLSWLVSAVVTTVYLGFAFLLSPPMTLLVLLCGGTLVLALRFKSRLAKGKGEILSKAYESMYGAISEHLAGMKTAKSHGVERSHVDLFLGMTRDVESAHVKVLENSTMVSFWFSVGSTCILATIVYVALYVLALSTANLLLLVYLFSRLIPMFSSLHNGYQSLLSYMPAYENVKRLELRCAEAAEFEEGAQTRALLREIEFKNVSFRYRSESEYLTLDSLNLTIEAGKTTALVGPSGAGKSTVADLAVGLLTPSQGHVLVDGVPLGTQELRAWRRNVGYVAQDTFVFHDTVRANLRLTRPEATDSELWEALRAAAADSITLPRGLDTVLGDRGVRLSGGERQRLALARALLRQPALLVLDEATSSLDAENERRIQHAIDRLRGRMTLLVIAHRLSTVRRADTIHVLEGGRVVESGNWESLVRKLNGRFRALCEAQGLASAQPVEAT